MSVPLGEGGVVGLATCKALQAACSPPDRPTARPLGHPPRAQCSPRRTLRARRLIASCAGPGRVRLSCSRNATSCSSHLRICSSSLGGGGMGARQGGGGPAAWGACRQQWRGGGHADTHWAGGALRAPVAARVQAVARSVEGRRRLLGLGSPEDAPHRGPCATAADPSPAGRRCRRRRGRGTVRAGERGGARRGRAARGARRGAARGARRLLRSRQAPPASSAALRP
jgi:hypothetical protein